MHLLSFSLALYPTIHLIYFRSTLNLTYSTLYFSISLSQIVYTWNFRSPSISSFKQIANKNEPSY